MSIAEKLLEELREREDLREALAGSCCQYWLAIEGCECWWQQPQYSGR